MSCNPAVSVTQSSSGASQWRRRIPHSLPKDVGPANKLIQKSNKEQNIAEKQSELHSIFTLLFWIECESRKGNYHQTRWWRSWHWLSHLRSLERSQIQLLASTHLPVRDSERESSLLGEELIAQWSNEALPQMVVGIIRRSLRSTACRAPSGRGMPRLTVNVCASSRCGRVFKRRCCTGCGGTSRASPPSFRKPAATVMLDKDRPAIARIPRAKGWSWRFGAD